MAVLGLSLASEWSKRARIPRWTLVCVVIILIHSLFMLSIFDIYFRTPLIHGMPHHETKMPIGSNRLVLFVGDGCRADMFFEYDPTLGEQASLAPYLRGILETKGVWGVSHTRVPTESRPGHVALLAGIYEDVSAVTTGWKTNPVEFDHIFRLSSHAWAYGSPDIMPMFALTAPQMEYECYDKSAEDFASDASNLDTWVFEKIFDLFDEGRKNETLRRMLKAPHAVFFLHLLGLDNNGHAFRPRSPEYAATITKVDEGVRRTVEMMEEFFGDGRTAYVYTADHGMSDRGNHGDGDRHCTRTPLVAWGPGIRGAVASSADDRIFDDPVTPGNWHLGHLRRSDVNQADVAQLMALMAGVPFPVNAVGVLPVDMLGGTMEERANAIVTNAQQHLSNYRRKSEVKEMSCRLRFAPYSQLADPDATENELLRLLEVGNFEVAISKALEVIDRALAGLRYFQTYDWLFLMSIVAAGYVFCIVYAAGFLLRELTPFGAFGAKGVRTGASSSWGCVAVRVLCALVLLWCVGQRAPLLYYAYVVLTFFVLDRVVADLDVWMRVARDGLEHPREALRFLLSVVLCVAVGEAMVVIFYHREWCAALLLSFGVWGCFCGQISVRLRVVWIGCCVACTVFTSLIPIDVGHQLWLVNIGAACLCLFPLVQLLRPVGVLRSRYDYAVFAWLLLLNLTSWVLVNFSSYYISRKEGLPFLCSFLAYVHLVLSGANLLTLPSHFVARLVGIFASLGPPFLLLSIAYESLFYAIFGALILVWVLVERRLAWRGGFKPSLSAKRSPGSTLELSHVRVAIFFLFFVFLGLFGSGNVASASSFELSSCYRFTTAFDPFWMSALLIFKLIVPFIIVGSAFSIVCTRFLCLPSWALCFIALVVSDVSTLNFFFRVSDEGSWLDIGQSIAHFAIMNFMIVLLLLLLAGCYPLVWNASTKRVGKTE